jgi:hypothetical protein
VNQPSSTVSPDHATPPGRFDGPGEGGAPSRPAVTASAGPHTPLTVKGLLDVVVLVVATPVLLLAGVPARAYLIAAGAWIVLRAIGILIDRVGLAISPSRAEIGLRLAYLMGRLIALAAVVVLLRHADGRSAALTALLVMLVAFTIELSISFVYRPRRR